ncbi:MAG TPA: hypothetical protein VHT93_14685 [Pseudolabrys sp.]|jgi:hypothetical protein|nr:hypothetical protein [Pseudolabrys sp.]
MNRPTLRLPPLLAIAALGLFLAGCATTPSLTPEAPPPQVTPTLPPAFPPQDIVGRWGLAAYHREEDRGRTEAAAASQCRQPYIITLGPTGGVMMHLADQATPTELRLKGAPGGKTYIGPPDDPPGGMQDREVVQFDGRLLILRWIDPEVQGRYGTMVYVRCGAEGAKKPAAKPRPKAAAKPAAAKPAAAPKPVQ